MSFRLKIFVLSAVLISMIAALAWTSVKQQENALHIMRESGRLHALESVLGDAEEALLKAGGDRERLLRSGNPQDGGMFSGDINTARQAVDEAMRYVIAAQHKQQLDEMRQLLSIYLKIAHDLQEAVMKGDNRYMTMVRPAFYSMDESLASINTGDVPQVMAETRNAMNRLYATLPEIGLGLGADGLQRLKQEFASLGEAAKRLEAQISDEASRRGYENFMREFAAVGRALAEWREYADLQWKVHDEAMRLESELLHKVGTMQNDLTTQTQQMTAAAFHDLEAGRVQILALAFAGAVVGVLSGLMACFINTGARDGGKGRSAGPLSSASATTATPPAPRGVSSVVSATPSMPSTPPMPPTAHDTNTAEELARIARDLKLLAQKMDSGL